MSQSIKEVQDWKKVTHHFDDIHVWKERLKCLALNDDIDFDLVLKRTRNRKSNSKEIFFLFEIFFPDICTDRKGDYISFYISKYLLDDIRNVLFSCSNINELVSKNVYADIFNQIQQKILEYISPTLSFEFEVYQKAFSKSRESYSEFLQDITSSKEWLTYFFESYPVLLNLLFRFIEDFKSNFKLIAERLNNDILEIEHTFYYEEILSIDKISFFLGDFHKDEQTTISFSGLEKNKRVYTFFYKPRSLAPDNAWNIIVTFLQRLGLKKSVELAENIDRTQYAWQNGVEITAFNNDEKLKDFFFNQGSNAALAYFFNVQDLIADNITINNDLPLFFDLEMSFCPQNPLGGDYRTKAKSASDFLLSVIKTGLIPSFGFETANNIGYSNSGISFVKNKKNLPLFKNDIISVNRYCLDFEEGFKSTCFFFIEKKESILSFLNNSRDIFANMQTRSLIRLTFTYSELLKESHTPLYMSSYYEYYRLFELLWRGYEKDILPGKIIQKEIFQMLKGDVPLFLSSPLSKDIYDYNGNLIIKNYYQKSGYETMVQKIGNNSPEIIREQTNIIRRSLYIHNDSNLPVEYKFTRVFKEKKSDKIASLIDDIASFVYELNPYSEDKYFAYSDYVISKEDIWSQGLQNCDMFQGIEGVGLFLTLYYSLSNNSKALIAASKIFNQSIELLNANKNILLDQDKVKIGLVNYPISTFYFSLLANQILGKDYFHIDNVSFSLFLEYIKVKYNSDEHYCYLSGTTGTVLLLMRLYDVYPVHELYNLIEMLGHYLLSSSYHLNENMICWRRKTFDKWGGFAHGNSSMSYALFKLSVFLKNENFYKSAIKALQYDQSLFNFNKNKWDKSIDFEGDVHYSWGNGSAGIGLSRYLIAGYYCNDFMQYEMKTAIQHINDKMTKMISEDHSICSGILGMLEVKSILDPKFDCECAVRNIFDDITIGDLKCGGWEENPLVTGLFYGFAGIGYNLIKLVYKKNTPSLLWI